MFAGRTMIALGQVAILTGVLIYNEKNSKSSPLGIIDIVVFFALLIVIEIYYQIYQWRRAKHHKIPDATMTSDEFHRRVR